MASQSDSFREALLAKGDEPLTHSIGKQYPSDTILTERELCGRLESLRDRIRSGVLPKSRPERVDSTPRVRDEKGQWSLF